MKPKNKEKPATKPEIKVVDINAHINQTKGSGNPEARRRGPRGPYKKSQRNSTWTDDGNKVHEPQTRLLLSQPINNEGHGNPKQPELPKPSIVPAYDTTEDAKNFLKMPFEIWAASTGIKELMLDENEVVANLTATKTFYDRVIYPNLGENAWMYQFSMGIGMLAWSKYKIWREHPKTLAKKTSKMNLVPQSDRQVKVPNDHTASSPLKDKESYKAGMTSTAPASGIVTVQTEIKPLNTPPSFTPPEIPTFKVN